MILSRPNDVYFASVINHNSLAIFEELEKALLDNQERKVVAGLSSHSHLLKVTLTLSHARKVVVAAYSPQKGEICSLSGTLTVYQALLTLEEEVSLIIDEGDENIYNLCIEHMVENGAFEAGLLPTIILQHEMFEQSYPAYDCILVIERADQNHCSTNHSQLIDKMFEMVRQNSHMTIIRMSDRGNKSGIGKVCNNAMQNTSPSRTIEDNASADYHRCRSL